jgi:cytochrome c-type biogenesis protein CcsB
MKKLSNILFSMQTMGILIAVFAVSIGAATFIENDFGTRAAKAVVYNATWFNILLALLGLNLAGNIILFRMYRKKKFTLFLFHFAFLIILIGAAITRFISFEGSMHIREGETSDEILSDETFVKVVAEYNGEQTEDKDKVLFSVLTRNNYSNTIHIGGKTIHIETKAFIPNATEVISSADKGVPFAVLVASYGQGRESYYLQKGKNQNIGNYLISWNYSQDAPIIVKYEDDQLQIRAKDTITEMPMTGEAADTLIQDIWHHLKKNNLYQFGDLNFVLTEFYPSGTIDYKPYDPKKASLPDALILKITDEKGHGQVVALRGGKGYTPEEETVVVDGVKLRLSYGSQIIKLPFALKLKDFQLETYPGSNSPSSYASEVILIDKEKKMEKPYRIYMNHVLNHRGYRFFQSSYDPDLKGTILSVNHDGLGTTVTYIGYFLMSLGMFLSLFNKYTRFGFLGKVLKNGVEKYKGAAIALTIPLLLLSNVVFGQHDRHLSVKDIPVVDKQEAEAFGKLLVQSRDGRIKPVNTLASELLRKLTKKPEYEGLIPEQVLLGMVSNPLHWQQVPLIKIRFGVARNKELQKILGVEGDYASYMDFIDMKTGNYKLGRFVQEAYNKKPANRGLFDKDIMKADEKVNICYMIYTGELLRLLPDPTDSHKPWFSLDSKITGLPPQDSMMISQILPAYFNAVKNGNYKDAADLREGIMIFQQKFGKDIIPSESKVKAEILYNKWMIFDNLSKVYGLLGMIMFIVIFIDLFKNSKALKKIINILILLTLAGFILQTFGLALRWYISGHAPWSDGYESMIYIGWITMLAGLLFARQSAMTVAATTILTSVILMVAHLTWMEPEITNLVPVLKSYWLTIHVSVITASYGFLALSMLLGFINLILMIMKKEHNREFLSNRIIELTAINERAMTIGLYMLTIGTFLGGVWANESWGRYWGWDPKETWALVSVLVYTFVLHMRFIPGFKGKFAFNFASVISYFSIIMTYFGVNFYLSGLHSYAKGDPVPIPGFIYYAIGVIALVSVWAYVKEEKMKEESGSIASS